MDINEICKKQAKKLLSQLQKKKSSLSLFFAEKLMNVILNEGKPVYRSKEIGTMRLSNREQSVYV